MPILYKDRVKEVASNKPNASTAFNLPRTSSDPSTETFYSGYNGSSNSPECMATNGTDWESFVGTFTAGTPDTLARTTFLASSTGSSIDWSSGGDVTIFVTPSSERLNQMSNMIDSLVPGGRLTPSTGVPYQTTYQFNVTRVYYTPFVHNVIRLRDGNTWKAIEFTETFFDLGTRPSNTVFDVFAYLSAGTIAFELVQWASVATRSIALSYLDGVLVKSDDNSRLYLGTVGNPTLTTTDSSHIYNHYNKMPFVYRSSIDSTAHTYTTTSFRNWNGGTGLPLAITLGQPEVVTSQAYCRFYSGLFQTSGVFTPYYAGNESGGTMRLHMVGSAIASIGRRTQVFQEYGNAAGGTWSEAQHTLVWNC